MPRTKNNESPLSGAFFVFGAEDYAVLSLFFSPRSNGKYFTPLYL